MPDINLTQAEADALLALDKHKVDDRLWPYPALGANTHIPLHSGDKRETFVLDINRGKINLSKVTYQNRARHVVVLARIDLEGPSHTNPDEAEIPCPHIHLYREGFGDKWAYLVPPNKFSNLSDLWQTLSDFMGYCNIVEPPAIQRGLI